jgi:hypothetical protein
MYMTVDLVNDQHRRDIEQASRTRRAVKARALQRAARRAHRAEHRMVTARNVAARLRTELES